MLSTVLTSVCVCVCTDQVDHHVFVERGPPLSSHLTDVDDGLGVVGVDVEDGSVDDSSHVSWIRRRASHTRICGETDLETRHVGEVTTHLTLYHCECVCVCFMFFLCLLPGCWRRRARCRAWCRTAGQTGGRFHRRYLGLQTLRLHGAGWTSPEHTQKSVS